MLTNLANYNMNITVICFWTKKNPLYSYVILYKYDVIL